MKTPTYHIAAKPNLPIRFYNKIEKFSELNSNISIHKPLHTTLHYLGKINKSYQQEIIEWIKQNTKNTNFQAKVESIQYFELKDSNQLAYYLKLKSKELLEIHQKMQRFSFIHKDIFNYIPHITLFYSDTIFTKKETEDLYKSLDIEIIQFQEIYLASRLNGQTTILK